MIFEGRVFKKEKKKETFSKKENKNRKFPKKVLTLPMNSDIISNVQAIPL